MKNFLIFFLLANSFVFTCLGSEACQAELGQGAQCKNIADCTTGALPGFCPGGSEIQCCSEFTMRNAFVHFNPSVAPWQRTALTKAQHTLRWYLEFREFSCRFRNQQPDGTFCGSEGGIHEIQMHHVAQYYASLEHQNDSLDYLQEQMVTKPALQPTWFQLVKDYRNLNSLTSTAPAPDISGSSGSCTTPYHGYQGHCIDISKCTGATFNGLCSGGSNNLCCVAETASANPSQEYLSQSQFRSLFTGISSTRADAFRPYFNAALGKILQDNPSSFTRCHRIAAFVAQIGHESAGLRYMEEIASGTAYNGRTDLGNVQPGDGPRFKGRGPIQLTGRANYRSAGNDLGKNFEQNPEQVCFPSGGFDAAVWFWNKNNLNRFCTGDYNDFTALTRRINGGTNGITDRRNRWATAKSLLGCSNTPQASYILSEAGLDGEDADPQDIAQFKQEYCNSASGIFFSFFLFCFSFFALHLL